MRHRSPAHLPVRAVIATLTVCALVCLGPALAILGAHRAQAAPSPTQASRTHAPAGTPAEKASKPSKPSMNPAKAVLLGLVEGVTEYLPVSSTGHLMVTERALDLGRTSADRDAADSYAVLIQFGAILAVLVVYRARVLSLLRGLVSRDDDGRNLLVALIVAFIPAALVGVAFEDPIKSHLFGAWPVVVAWIVGGVAILVFHQRGLDTARTSQRQLSQLGTRAAFLIGVAQILSLWPGTSRSLVTLLAGLAVGLSLSAAVEFTFLLGLATLGAASVYETAKNGSAVVDAFGVRDPIIGVVVAFVAAVVAVKWMVTYLERHDLRIFGWYRIGIGAAVALALATGLL